IIERILEAHANVSNLSMNEAKLQYIKAWQSLPEYDIQPFVVKFKDSSKREEILGIASNRLIKLSINGDALKTWRYNTMKSWNVNWQNKQLTIEFENETITLLPLYNIDSKCIHEFIGAYIFLSMRSKDKIGTNDPLQQETLFHRLTSAYM
ncbi:unnamed protein product, partial [Didymodactylos carnosus]